MDRPGAQSATRRTGLFKDHANGALALASGGIIPSAPPSRVQFRPAGAPVARLKGLQTFVVIDVLRPGIQIDDQHDVAVRQQPFDAVLDRADLHINDAVDEEIERRRRDVKLEDHGLIV